MRPYKKSIELKSTTLGRMRFAAYKRVSQGWLRDTVLTVSEAESLIVRDLTYMLESVPDRPTKSHEYIFLLTKRERYFYDHEAIKEPAVDEEYRTSGKMRPNPDSLLTSDNPGGDNRSGLHRQQGGRLLRNKRTVWQINTVPYKDAHFAVFPPKLPRTCILAGTSARGCCKVCGAPWTRVVLNSRRETRSPSAETKHGDLLTDIRASGPGNVAFGLATMVELTTKTAGYRPGCRCCGLPIIKGPPTPLVQKDGENDAAYQVRTADWEQEQMSPWTAEWEELKPLYDRQEVAPCTVLDMFAGSGTTGYAAVSLGRDAVLIEPNPDYRKFIVSRCTTNRGLPGI